MAIKHIDISQSNTLPNFTQIGIFGSKTNHLATLVTRNTIFVLHRVVPTYVQQRLTKLGSILTVSDVVVQHSTTQKPYKMNYLCVGKGLCRYLHIFVSHCVVQQRLTKLGSILTVPDATV
jgi:hypothetical protein